MKQNGQVGQNQISGQYPADSIDWIKLRSVIRRNWIWVFIILFITNSAGWVYLRYKKPIFESSSELKLDIKSEASSLGLTRFSDPYNIDNLSGEIELINSRLFFNKVIETIDIDVQYFTHGKILDDEKYKHTPFIVDYELKNNDFYDRPINIDLLNEKKLELSYVWGGKKYSELITFGQPFENEHFRFTITTTPNFSNELLDEQFYFVINSHESLIAYLENNITVEPLNLTAHTIRISFRDYNKYKAHDLVNAIDTLYLEYTHLQKNQANENKIDYLNQQMKETEKILEEFEDYFENFTIDNKTVNLDQDVKKTLNYMIQIDSQRFELRARISHIEGISEKIIIEDLENINIKRQYVPDYILKDFELFDKLYFEQKQLALAYKENTFAFERKLQELDIVRGNLVTDLNQYKLNLYESLTALNKKKNELESNLLDLPSKGTEYNKAKRYYALYEEMYLSLMQSKNEFELARAGTVPDFKILAPATIPINPISPIKMLVYGITIISGLIFCFLFIGISYLVSDKITGISEIENLSKAPVLGTLPFEGSVSKGVQLFVNDKPKSAISEAFRAIRTNIEFMVPGIKNKVISVSSTISGEGKTFVTLNLGGVIAMSRLNVVILDLDLRKPKIHQNFGDKDTGKGVSTILIKKHTLQECISPTGLENLNYIPAGPIPPNPSELLLNGAFDKMINNLKETFDVIILDTPPIGLVTDAIMAMKTADLKIFILRADYSLRSYLQAVNRLVDVNKFKNIGLILNGLKSRHNHGYGYGYSYDYGSSYYENPSNRSWIKTVRRKLGV